MRINKFLSSLGIASRRAIDKYIEEGRIKVNGVIASTGIDVTEEDEIYIDNKKIETNRIEEKVYFMLNKPLEVLSASSDDRGRRTVVDLIKTDKRIFPIGRLDYMTSGLILLTNDGELFNRLVHPKSEIYKKYYITLVILEQQLIIYLKTALIRRIPAELDSSLVILNRLPSSAKIPVCSTCGPPQTSKLTTLSSLPIEYTLTSSP